MSEADFDRLSAWRAGDRHAGAELVGAHYTAILRFFELRAGYVADDLTQATFLAAVEAKDRFEGHASFRAFLFGIARNKLLELLRKSRRRDAALAAAKHRGPDTGLTPSGLVAIKDEQRTLLLALNRLSEDLQIAMQLHYWEGMAGNEVAEVLGIPPSTVRNRLSRARAELRTHIDAVAPGPRVSKSLLDDLAGWTRSLVGPDVPVPASLRYDTAD